MKLRVSQHSRQGKSPRSEKRVNQLWQQVQKQKQKLVQFEKVMDELVIRYQQECQQEQQQSLPALIALTEKLIDFLGRKTLSQRQCRQLTDWIRDLTHKINGIDAEKASALDQQMRTQIIKREGIDQEEYDEAVMLFREQAEDILESLFKDMANEDETDACDDEWVQGRFDGDDDTFNFTTDGNNTSGDQHTREEPSPAPGDAINHEKWVRQLFRKTANLLHPDKESDPALKQQKHEAMATLLKAREEEDIAAILSLNLEYGNDDALSLSDQDAVYLQTMLEDQLGGFEDQYDHIIEQSPIYELVYEYFYASTSKEREQNLKDFQTQEKAHRSWLTDVTKGLRNLTILKQHLKDREAELRNLAYESMFT